MTYEVYHEFDGEDLGIQRLLLDIEVTQYGEYLLEMEGAHGLAILNGLPRCSGYGPSHVPPTRTWTQHNGPRSSTNHTFPGLWTLQCQIE